MTTSTSMSSANLTYWQIKYLRWLKAAYCYYFLPEKPDLMSDREWDLLGQQLYTLRAQLPLTEFPILHDPQYSGGSLYWLAHRDYPLECRTDA